jgi:hypothetical protein
MTARAVDLMNYSVNPVRSQVSAGRILAAGWFYALSVVLFALDIAHASLFLGSSWLNNPPTDLDFYGWGFIVFIGLCFVGFYYVRDLTPAIDVEGDPLRFSREGSARHFALTGLVLAMPLVLFDPGDPLYMFSAGLMVVQAMVDALLVRDVRQAIPHAKRPTVLLRAMLTVAACYGLAALLGFELVALLLRVAVAVLAPVAEGLPLELCDLGDETLRGEAHELNRELRRVTWACGGLLALMLADMLLGVSEMAWVLGLVCVLAVVYVSLGRFTLALHVRTLLAVVVGVVLGFVVRDTMGIAWLACTVVVLVGLSVVPVDQTAPGLVAFLGFVALAFWLERDIEIRMVIEVFAPLILVLMYYWQRVAEREHVDGRRIRLFFR